MRLPTPLLLTPLLLTTALLAGCGQKGPLFLPPPAATALPAADAALTPAADVVAPTAR